MRIDALQAEEMRVLYRSTPLTYAQLGAIFGVCKSAAHKIVTEREFGVQRMRTVERDTPLKPSELALKVLANDWVRFMANHKTPLPRPHKNDHRYGSKM